MTTNTPHTIIHRTIEKEEPPPLLPTHLTQPLEIQHLPQRHPPQRQDILMHVVLLGGGPALERRRVAPHRREVAVVQPVQDRLFLRQAGIALPVGGRVDGVFA
jgi:hypothetical protein